MLDRIVIPVLIFFNSKYEIDEELNIKYIKLLNQSPFEHIILLGTTSEGVLISLRDKIKIIKLYEKYLNNNINIILTPSLWSIRDFKYLINMSDRINDVLFLPNSYFNRKSNELIKYINQLFQDTNKNIYLYNLPKNTLVNFSFDFVKELIKNNSRIKGIKLSHAKNEEIINYVSIKDFDVLYGSDKDIFLSLTSGANKVVAQNLSAAIHLNITEANIQNIANDVRKFVSTKEHKIKSLKEYMPNFHNTVLV